MIEFHLDADCTVSLCKFTVINCTSNITEQHFVCYKMWDKQSPCLMQFPKDFHQKIQSFKSLTQPSVSGRLQQMYLLAVNTL